MHLRARGSEVPFQVARERADLRLRRGRRDPLPAQLARLLEQRDVVAAFGRQRCSLHAGQAAAHHDDFLFLRRGSEAVHGLLAQHRVDGAAVAPFQAVLGASVVAVDAHVNVVEPAFFRLVRQVRIGEQRTPERHEIADAFLQHAVGGDRIAQLSHRDHRHRHHLLDRGGKVGEAGERLVEVGRHPLQRFIAARRYVERIGPRFDEQPRLLQRVFQGGAALGVLGRAHAEHHGIVGPGAPAHFPNDIAGEFRAAAHAAAVLVGSPVGARRQELADQVAVPAVHLDAVEARVPGAPCRLAVGLDDSPDLGQAQRPRDDTRPEMQDGGRRRGNDRLGFLGRARARVMQLHEDLRVVSFHGLGHFAQRRDELVVVDPHAAGAHADVGEHPRDARHEQGRAALRPFLHEGGVFREDVAFVMAIACAHRRHYDAVLQLELADPAGLKQPAQRFLHGSPPVRRLLRKPRGRCPP